MPSRSPRPKTIVESPPEMPMGSRQVLAVLLRAVGQALETWADRLDAAITQVTATLPDPRVRKDLFAKLWRLWLTIVTRITRSLPVRWRAFVAGLLPIVLLGSLIIFGLWVTLFQGQEVNEMNPTNATSPSALEERTPLSAPDVEGEDFKDLKDEIETKPPDREEKNDRPEMPAELTPEAEPEPEPEIELPRDQVSAEPLGPPVPDWSSLSSPLEQRVQSKLISKLSPSWQPLVQRLQVNFRQQEITVYLTDQWQTLTSTDQHRLVKTIQQQARQLDFPHLRFVDEQNQLLARTAIVGEGIIFQNTP